jgi:hypothetical protein
MARQPLQVSTANVEGLRLAPQAGATIVGHLRMELSGGSRPDPRQIFLSLRSLQEDEDGSAGSDFGDGFSTLTQVRFDGSFEWKNVSAGTYSVQLSDASEMPDWFIKSIAVAGRDVLESGFNVSGGLVTLDLVASDRAAAAEGVVTDQKEDAVADSVVVAVPEARFRNHPERYRTSISDQSGRFTLRGLPPGDYTLYAWESMDGEAYLDPEFLRLYEGQGAALHVKEGERAAATLKVIPGSKDEP